MKKTFLFLLACTLSIQSKDANDDTAQLEIGNFALPATQQLAPLFSVGQLVIDQNSALVLLSGQQSKGCFTQESTITPAILYGITDYLSVFINIPINTDLKESYKHASGIGDVFAQFECAVYTKNEFTYSNQATIIGTIIAPTGSPSTTPHTGSGAPGFFIGGTYSHLATDWYYFTSGGALLTTKKNHTQLGNQFLYQAGWGRNLGNPGGNILTFFVECDGTYEQHTKNNNISDKKTGGNTVYFGPTLWFSTRRFIAQLGASFPVIQHLNNKKYKSDYTFAFSFAWTLP